jgi:hypothetical protein
VNSARHACRRHPHAGLRQLVGIRLPFVAQDIILIGGQEGWRQPSQVVERGACWSGALRSEMHLLVIRSSVPDYRTAQ